MKFLTLRAAATALLLGSAAIGAATSAFAQATVSAAVGRPLQEARTLADSGRYKEAMARIDAAGSAAKSAHENSVVNQMRQYVAVKSGDTSTALGAKAKFAQDANAGRWRDVIAGAEALRKQNALDAQSMLVVAQAHYRLNDPKACMSYIRSNRLGGETALALLQRCAYDAGDDVTQRSALEQLVTATGKPEHWKNLLRLAERSRNLSDHNTLDILRLKGLTGSYNGADDITLHVQMALQLKMAAEGKALLEKSLADKTLPTNDRNNRLVTLANARVAENAKNAAQALAAANSAKEGDGLVAIGEDMIGQGKAKEAITIIQAGIAKGVKDMANAQIRLGSAYLAAGQKPQALRAFQAAAAAKGDEKTTMVAQLYVTYARR
jgi:tetratricopeptide (TPR) repeat protein